MDLISVIIPAYNVENTISKCIDSVLLQSYSNIEIIIINDGSIDNTKLILDKYCLKDNRVHVYHITNHGVSYARNLGIKKSMGEYIAFIDSDDSIEPEYLSELYSRLKNDNSDMVICDINYSQHPDRNLYFSNDSCLETKRFLLSYFLKYKTAHVIGAPFARLIRAKIIKENNILFVENESYAEDFEFNLNLYNVVNKISIISRKLYNYKEDSSNSLTSKNMRKANYMFNRQIKHLLPFILNLCKKYGIHHVYNQFIVYFMFKDLGFVLQGSYGNKTKYNLYKRIMKYIDNNCDINSIDMSDFDAIFKTYINIYKYNLLTTYSKSQFYLYMFFSRSTYRILIIRKNIKSFLKRR